jgi:type II secretory pathway component PulF
MVPHIDFLSFSVCPLLDMQHSQDIRIEDVLAFNEQLRIIAASGVPLDLGNGQLSDSLTSTLTDIGTSVAIQHAKGLALESVFTKSIPTQYRQSVLSWVANNPTLALDPLVQFGQNRRDWVSRWRTSIHQPWILLLLAYLGAIYLLQTLVPSFESIYAQIRKEPGPGLSVLIWIKTNWLLAMVGVPVAAIAVSFLWTFVVSKRMLGWLPRRVLDEEFVEKANQARNLLGTLGADAGHAALSPLLAWATDANKSVSQRAEALLFAEQLYLQLSREPSMRWRQLLPVLFASLSGGLIVIGFALGLFVPVVELLYHLTSP